MGMVYLATDLELGERVAIKTLRSDILTGDETAIERFRNEIRLARRIAHRNIVRTHDLGKSGDVFFLTMEYVEGATLRSVLDSRGHLGAGGDACDREAAGRRAQVGARGWNHPSRHQAAKTFFFRDRAP